MRGQHRNAQTGQRRGDGRRADDIRGGRRQTHAQNRADDHGEHEARDEHVAAQLDDEVGELQPQSRQGEDGDDNTGGCARADDGAQRFAGGNGALDHVGEAHPVVLIQKAANDVGRDGPDGRNHRRCAHAEHEHQQQDDRHEELHALPDGGAQIGDHFGRQAAQVMLDRLQIDHLEQADVIHDCGENGRDADDGIRCAGCVSQNKGRRAHDRGHNLAARGGDRLDRAREFGLVAVALHQRDGERAGADDVRHAASGDHAEQSAGDNGHFGGAAAIASGQRDGDILKDHVRVRDVQVSGEQQEQIDVIRGGADRGAVNAAVGEDGQRDAAEAVAAMAKQSGNLVAEEGIENRDNRDDRQNVAQHAATRFQRQQRDDAAEDEQLVRQLVVLHVGNVGFIVGDDVNADDQR